MAGIGISHTKEFAFLRSGGLMPIQLGTLIENDWNPANWSGDTGVCTFEQDGITLNFSGTGFAQGIYYNKYLTNLENFEMDAIILINNLTSYGPSLSQILPTTGINLDKSLLVGTGPPNNGRLDLWNGVSYIASSTNTVIPFINGDYSVNKITKIKDVLTLTMKNVRLDITNTYTFTFDFNYPFIGNVLTPVVWAFGFSGYYACDAKVTTFKYTGLDYKNSDACYMSDSKGLYSASSYSNTAIELLRTANPTKTINYSGGVNETLADAISKLPELISLNSKKYFIDLGCNDYRLGQSASIISRMTAIKTGLEAGVPGCSVYYVNSAIEGTLGTAIGATGTNFVIACGVTVFGAPNCIDMSAITLLDLEADQIHYGDAGMIKKATALQTKL